MAFNYDDTLATDLAKVRFFIGDKVANGGPRPGDGNFTDEEITGVLTVGDSWEETVADMLDTLATEWVRYPSFQADNFAISRSHIAKNFQAQAEAWRKQHGLASPENKYGAPGSQPITRADAYSNDKDSVTE
jgi:hypothetical protein